MKNNCERKDLMFYKCPVCGNIIVKLVDSGLVPQCCGRDMEVIEAGTTDASIEKHVPVFSMDGCKVVVKIGEEEHPMTDDHHILWIIANTTTGFHAKQLCPEDDPEACFKLCKGEELISIYELCNLHGLWTCKRNDKEDMQDDSPISRD